MNYQNKKVELIEFIRVIESEKWEGNSVNSLVNDISDLKSVIENDFFTVVVLGEFKRGKSTFINSLLGSELLPSNVTPTTATINALMYSDEKTAEIVLQDGSTKNGVATLEYLDGFSVDGMYDASDINYIKIGYPSDLLCNNVILVDTPGVSDINQQRVQVTYDFIPKSDVVIFLLDATSPMKRTEKEFIEEHLLKIGLEKVIFIANRFDEIEEEDEEEVLDDMKKRLKAAFKPTDISEIQVIPFSAYQALQGELQEDRDLIKESNLSVVKDKIQSLIYEGTSPENKLRGYTNKLCLGVEVLLRQIEQETKIIVAGVTDLEEVIEKMRAVALQEESRKNKLGEYVGIQKKDMLAMVRKSLQYFQLQLKEEVFEAVDSYRGTEFKSYIEKQIVSIVQKRIAQWVNTYAISMNQMLAKLNKELAMGLARYFNTSMKADGYVSTEFQSTPIKLNIEAEDISNITMKAGVIAGGAAGLLALVGGPFLLPFIGLAGYPFLQKKMLDDKLQEAKAKVIPELHSLLNQTFNTLYEEIEKNIEISIEQIQLINEKRFLEIFNTYVVKIENEIDVKRSNQDALLEKQSDLSRKNDLLAKISKELRRG